MISEVGFVSKKDGFYIHNDKVGFVRFWLCQFRQFLPKPLKKYCRMTSPRDAGHIRGLTLAVRAAQVKSSYYLEAALPITCRAAFYLWRSRMTTDLRSAIGGYLLAKKQERVSRNTMSIYRYVLDDFAAHMGNRPVTDITAELVRGYLVKVGERRSQNGEGKVSASTVDIHFRNLKTFLRFLLAEGLITQNPFDRIKRPRGEKRLPSVLNEEQVNRLLDGVRGDGDPNAFRDYCILLFFLATGVRLKELADLSIDDLNLDEGYAKVYGKGGKERIVPLGGELQAELWRYIHKQRRPKFKERALFLNKHGLALGREGVSMIVRRALTDYIGDESKKHGAHLLRHTFSTLYLRENRDLERLRKILGHSDIGTTQIYTHLVITDLLDTEAFPSPMDRLRRRRNGRAKKGAATLAEDGDRGQRQK